MRHILGLGIKVAALCMGLLYAGVGAAEAVNYDTAWTFVYDGGSYKSGNITYAIEDNFAEVKILSDGNCVCIGKTRDSLGIGNTLLMKLDNAGKIAFKKLYPRSEGCALCNANNGDLLIGGHRSFAPYIIRTDSMGSVKWATWYYDSINDRQLLSSASTVNSILETSNGRIACALGDVFPDNNGYTLNNYAGYLQFDSIGNRTNWGEWHNDAGYEAGGWSIVETSSKRFMIGGNQAVYYIDTAGTVLWRKKYTFSLAGVGTEVNNISRVRKLRDGTYMVAGQAYEGNCWTRYQRLYYDAWWSPISSSGSNLAWDTAGAQGANDRIYDFTQLINGNLVFVGGKGSSPDSGLWAFVTDSSGKTILWEKQYDLPGKDVDGLPLNNILPMSVCATPDTGFVVVGDQNTFGNNHNACAFKFVPKPPLSVAFPSARTIQSVKINQAIIGNTLRITLTLPRESEVAVRIFNSQGRKVAEALRQKSPAGKMQFTYPVSRFGTGVYVSNIETSNGVISRTINIIR